MRWIRRIRLPITIFLLMVYGGMLVLTLLHSHQGFFSPAKIGFKNKQDIVHDAKHCLICEFLFKKLPENQEEYTIFRAELMLSRVFPWADLLLVVGLSVVPFQKLGRAPPIFSC